MWIQGYNLEVDHACLIPSSYLLIFHEHLIISFSIYVYPSICLSLYPSVYLFSARCWTLAAFSASSIGLLGRGKTHTDIHASRGIQTHDSSVWVSDESSCLRPLGCCDRLIYFSSIVKGINEWMNESMSPFLIWAVKHYCIDSALFSFSDQWTKV
jgi:hypothetical protein